MPPLRLCALAAVALAGCQRPARVVLDPPSAHLHAKGQVIQIHATPYARSGRPLPQRLCRWSSSDEKVATVSGSQNQASITAVGAGKAAIRCAVGGIAAEAPVLVRVAETVEVSPERIDLKMLDQPRPAELEIRAYDEEGRPISGRPVQTRCLDERVCRGDDRGRVWPAGPGETTVAIEVDGARAEIRARVIDARTAAAKPRSVRGNPMLDYEKAVRSGRR